MKQHFYAYITSFVGALLTLTGIITIIEKLIGNTQNCLFVAIDPALLKLGAVTNSTEMSCIAYGGEGMTVLQSFYNFWPELIIATIGIVVLIVPLVLCWKKCEK